MRQGSSLLVLNIFSCLCVHRFVFQQKVNGAGNVNPVHKLPLSRHQKPGAKRNSNGGPPFPVPIPYHQPVPPFFHPMVPPPHIAVPGYAFPPGPGPFPGVENPLAKPVSPAPGQAFAPPAHAVDGKNVQPPVQGDPNAYVGNFSNGRPNIQEQGDHLNHAWHHQRPFPSRANIPMQQGLGPRPFIRPPFYGPPPGYMVGPSFPGKILIHSPLIYVHGCAITQSHTYIYAFLLCPLICEDFSVMFLFFNFSIS